MPLHHPSSRHYAAYLRYQDLLADAERSRLAGKARPPINARPPFSATLRRAGAWLTGLGQRRGGRDAVAGLRERPTTTA